MSQIGAEAVKALRDASGAGMMDCKRALIESDGDFDRAFELLRERGFAKAAKRSGRAADEGRIDAYIHFNNTVGSLVEINCETDFSANTDLFKELVHDVALHVASPASPRYLTRKEVPEDLLDQERRVYEAQMREQGRPEDKIPMIVDNKLESFFKEVVLLEQPFVKDDSKTIQEMLDEVSAQIGEKVAVRRFVRYKLGEELGEAEG